jgi:type VI secretion system protein ImpG
MPRLLSSKERRKGPRTSSYAGSEVFVSLVDGRNAPYRSELRQLAVAAYCTNRDLPMHMPLGTGRTDFTLESGAPVESVRVISGPTRPKPTWDEGEVTWRLISQLSLNYLSLINTNPEDGATALRDLLSLYSNMTEAHIRKQVEGVKTISSRPITRRVQTDGPIAFARGLEVTVTFDEVAFEGSGVFLLGTVLDEFFAKYVSLNSFTETVIRTLDRNEIIRWPARIGRRPML